MTLLIIVVFSFYLSKSKKVNIWGHLLSLNKIKPKAKRCYHTPTPIPFQSKSCKGHLPSWYCKRLRSWICWKRFYWSRKNQELWGLGLFHVRKRNRRTLHASLLSKILGSWSQRPNNRVGKRSPSKTIIRRSDYSFKSGEHLL